MKRLLEEFKKDINDRLTFRYSTDPYFKNQNIMKKKVLFVSDWTYPDMPLGTLVSPNSSPYVMTHWSCKKRQSTGLLYRWYCYFRGAFYIIKNRKKFDTIIIWQQMIGFILFVLNKVFANTRHPQVFVMSISYSTDLKGINGKIQKAFLLSALKYAKGLIWFSSKTANEAKDYFLQYSGKIYYAPMPVFKELKTKYKISEELNDKRFKNGVFCGGRSYRDFDIVIKAFNNTSIPLTIVCPDRVKISEPIQSDNIRVLRFSQVSREQYDALIDQSFCVVLSLRDEKSPCGLILFTYAMSHSIPVIATNSYSTRDYIIDGKNGLLFSLGKSDEILNAYQKLKQNKILLDKIVKNAKKTIGYSTLPDFILKILFMVEQ